MNFKVSRSAIYRLDVERTCGCKAAGDYTDAAYKEPRGEIKVSLCEQHKPAGEMMEELLRDILEKEAHDTPIPAPPAPVVYAAPAAPAPPAAPAAAAPSATEGVVINSAHPHMPKNPRVTVVGDAGGGATGAPARTVRTAGSSGNAGAARAAAGNRPAVHRPASAPPPAAGSGGHRPQGGSSRPSPFRRADGGSGLSQAAQSRLAAGPAPNLLRTDMDTDVPEDPRVTNLIKEVGLLDDPNDVDEGDDGGDDGDFEF